MSQISALLREVDVYQAARANDAASEQKLGSLRNNGNHFGWAESVVAKENAAIEQDGALDAAGAIYLHAVTETSGMLDASDTDKFCGPLKDNASAMAARQKSETAFIVADSPVNAVAAEAIRAVAVRRLVGIVALDQTARGRADACVAALNPPKPTAVRGIDFSKYR